MEFKKAQKIVDNWIKEHGVRYFDELTNMAQLTEEVGEVARIIARRYGEQSEKESDKVKDLGEELADVIFVVLCLANQTGIDLQKAFDQKKILESIENAGAIFLGKWTPEAVGDYLAGPNHTLPTSGNSRFSGSLGVETFMKNTSIIEFNKESLQFNSLDIINLAKSEGLHSHANSVQIRFED